MNDMSLLGGIHMDNHWVKRVSTWVGIGAGICTIVAFFLNSCISTNDYSSIEGNNVNVVEGNNNIIFSGDVGNDINFTESGEKVNKEIFIDEDNSGQISMDSQNNTSTSNDIIPSNETEKGNEVLPVENQNEDSTDKNESQREKILLTETHVPDDVVWGVFITDWDVQNDYGIDGNRYGSGVKIEISNMFTSFGDGNEKRITSRIFIPLSEEYKDPEGTVFSGIFILDKMMYESNSSATIHIIANDQELYTCVMDKNTTVPCEFSVNCGDADSIIVETEACLRGTSFIFGMVDPNE